MTESKYLKERYGKDCLNKIDTRDLDNNYISKVQHIKQLAVIRDLNSLLRKEKQELKKELEDLKSLIGIRFEVDELNVILDGLEDTKELIKQGKAKPVSDRYISRLKVIRTKIKEKLRKSRLKQKLKESK